jgi:hypothetical protein
MVFLIQPLTGRQQQKEVLMVRLLECLELQKHWEVSWALLLEEV